jgi:cysteine desulfurase family protein (TIGR01976 family)
VETDLSTFDVAAVRDCFPALRRAQDGVPCVFADAPGGTQVPRTVIEAVSRYLQWDNANTGGAFPTSEATDAVVAAARRAGADLLGCAPREIVFGANMTTLAFSLSRSVARDLRPGDEVVVTALDHDANIIPWVNAARDAGADVRWIGFDPHSCTLDLETLDNALGSRTRVVAFTLASNAVGTITAAEEVIRRARSTDALVIADAVHLAPHRAIDVSALGVDVLFCSAYKLFGPHIGIMFLRYEASDRLVPYKVRPALDSSPDRWETGTKNHEGLAGFTAAVDYIAGLGQSMATEGGRRPRVVAGMNAVANYEATLTARFSRASNRSRTSACTAWARSGSVSARQPSLCESATAILGRWPSTSDARASSCGTATITPLRLWSNSASRIGEEPCASAFATRTAMKRSIAS